MPLEEQLPHLRDPEFRARLIAEQPQENHSLAMMTRNWDWIFPFAGEPNYEPRWKFQREEEEATIGASSTRCTN